MKDLMRKFSKLGHLVLHAFAGKLSTANAYLFLNNQRRSVGCDKDVDCVQMPIPRLVEIYASQLPSDRSNLTAEDKLKESACD